MPAGSLLGALAVTQLADRVGRKKTIILAGIVWVIGSILQCASVVRVGNNFITIDITTLLSYTESGNARSWPDHFWYLRWSCQRCRPHLPIGNYGSCYSR